MSRANFADVLNAPRLLPEGIAVSDLNSQLRLLRSERQRTMLQLAIALVLTPVVVARLWHSEFVLVDARWLAGIGVALLSWVVVRTVADTASLLEEPCPSCGDCFFGGLTRAAGTLPLPPNECVNCRIGFDGSRAGH
jgi:hypothetical protein